MPAFARPSWIGPTIAAAFSGDMKIGSTPSATSPAVRSPAGVIEAV